MAEPKTTRTKASVEAFIDTIEDEQKREDCRVIMKLMNEATGKRPIMWGPSIVGYGSYHYRYASGREGDWPLTGFSPREQALTVYIMPGFKQYAPLMKKLGKGKTGKSCLCIKNLDDIDLPTLEKLTQDSVKHAAKRYT